jgi:prophage antirepressor-like protein
MSLSKQVSAHTQGAQQAPAFNPNAIRSVTDQNGQPALAIIEGICFVKPQFSYSQAHAHWHAFCASRGLAPAAKRFMAKNEKLRKRVAPMLTTDVNTMADVFMSLPDACPNYLQKCAAALYRCYNMDPPAAFVYEPIVASRARQAPQKGPQILEATAAPTQISSVALPAPVSEVQAEPAAAPLAKTPNPNATISLASSMPQAAASQLGRVFQSNRFCLRALQSLDGTIWFKGNEIAEALGYAHASKAIRTHVHETRRQQLQNIELSRGGNSPPLSKYEQEATWVTEAGVWQLVLASQTELAEQFRLWFTGEVLPQLARTGTYSTQPQLQDAPSQDLQALQFEQMAAHADAERQRAENLRLQSRLLRLQLASQAHQVAQELGLSMTPGQQAAAQLALDAAALPAHVSENSFTTAGEYLRMRGHSEAQVRSLQSLLGLCSKSIMNKCMAQHPQRTSMLNLAAKSKRLFPTTAKLIGSF